MPENLEPEVVELLSRRPTEEELRRDAEEWVQNRIEAQLAALRQAQRDRRRAWWRRWFGWLFRG